MLADVRVELLVARLSYASHVNPQYPLVSVIRRRHSTQGPLDPVQDWLERAVAEEKAHLPANLIVKFADYRIVSGDSEIFTTAGHRFEKVILLLGERKTYWNFYQSNLPAQRYIVGKASLPVSFCACCFHMQYARVLKTVIKNMRQPMVV